LINQFENNKEIDAINIWTNEKDSLRKYKKGMIVKVVSRILEKRHFERLIKQKCRGQSFGNFKSSSVTNFYI
jgi:hypothetical protein